MPRLRIPAQVESQDADRIACAPYNFVPLPEMVICPYSSADDLPRHDAFTGRSGWFDVTLTTKSPTYVRGGLSTGPRRSEALSEWDQAEIEKGMGAGDLPPFRERMKNKPEFFSVNDRGDPIIPGSSLRGMLRSLLEIVSYGKITRVTDRKFRYRGIGDMGSLGVLYRDHFLGTPKSGWPTLPTGVAAVPYNGRPKWFDYPSPRVRGGYLEVVDGQWYIRPAAQHLGESFVHIESGLVDATIAATPGAVALGEPGSRAGCWIVPARRITTQRSRPALFLDLARTTSLAFAPAAGHVETTIVRSGPMLSKHMDCAIYAPDSTAIVNPPANSGLQRLISIPAPLRKGYEEDMAISRDADHDPRPLLHGSPLFYSLDDNGGLKSFGSNMMHRLPYTYGIHDRIPEALRRATDIDYADALFGYIRTDTELKAAGIKPSQGDPAREYAGRVSVTDARLTQEYTPAQLWYTGNSTGAVVPRILGTPRATTVQHYLVQDYDRARDLTHFDSDLTDEWNDPVAPIRGSKRYWLQGDAPGFEEPDNELGEHDSQHTLMKPANPDITFRFRVHFENASDEELGALCWALHPLGDPALEYCHQIGMGKPLGMGAVKLSAKLHLIERSKRYTTLFRASPDGFNWEDGHRRATNQPNNDRISDLSNRKQLEFWTEAFEQHILTTLGFWHDSEGEGRWDQKLNEEPHLYKLERISQLLKMMEWPGFLADHVATTANRVHTEGGGFWPNTRYMSIDLPGVGDNESNEYRLRPVLPPPSHEMFGDPTGDAIPEDVIR